MCFLIIDSNDIDFIFLFSTFLDKKKLFLEFNIIFYIIHCSIKHIAALNFFRLLFCKTIQLKNETFHTICICIYLELFILINIRQIISKSIRCLRESNIDYIINTYRGLQCLIDIILDLLLFLATHF